MELTPLRPGSRSLIQAYGNGGFKISEQRFRGSVIVLDDSVIEIPSTSVDEVQTSHLNALTEGETCPDILLVGCGDEAIQFSQEHRDHLRRAGIAVDLMNTGAACRTFNFLQAEGRRVAALLIAVD